MIKKIFARLLINPISGIIEHVSTADSPLPPNNIEVNDKNGNPIQYRVVEAELEMHGQRFVRAKELRELNTLDDFKNPERSKDYNLRITRDSNAS